MITITSSNSISVKPRRMWPMHGDRSELCTLTHCSKFLSAKNSGLGPERLKNRQKHADDDGADDAGHNEQHDRFGDGDEHSKLAVQIVSYVRGQAKQFLVEPAGFFGDGDHFHDRWGKKLGLPARALGERRAALHFLDGRGRRCRPGSGCRWLRGRRAAKRPAERRRRRGFRASGQNAPARNARSRGPSSGVESMAISNPSAAGVGRRRCTMRTDRPTSTHQRRSEP